MAEGADGLECDVRLTRDGHLICHHDRRLGRTSNGRGPVSARNLDELHRLDFGSWRAGAAPASVLTLDRLLAVVRAAGRPLRLLIDVKSPGRYSAHLERRLVALLDRHGLASAAPDDPVRVSVMSFSPMAVRRVHRLAPALPTVQLLNLLPPGVRLGRMPAGTRTAGLSLRLVRTRPALVPALRAAGYHVYVWTVNHRADIDLVVRQGVDGIITDYPAETLAHLGR